ncbi:MAG TPA: hypothetical protein PLW32_07445 [Chitinophagaceae bacterium]|jgi:ABC-type iron transport system FetAB permease component|nr:hypothetical protein [Chitinophagaceae bacterium]
MKQVKHIQKIAFAILLVFAAQFVFAAFTTTGKKNNKQTESKYTLKNLSSFTNKGLSLSSIRYNSKLLANDVTPAGSMSIGNSINHLQMQSGNTTFIYPYKAKIKVPKFKTPSPSNF